MATNSLFHKCKRCGNRWIGRITRKPKQCTRCKRCDWDKNASELKWRRNK